MQINRVGLHRGRVPRCSVTPTYTGAVGSRRGVASIKRRSSSNSFKITADEDAVRHASTVVATRSMTPPDAVPCDSSSHTSTHRRSLLRLLLLAAPTLAITLSSSPGRGLAQAAEASIAAISTPLASATAAAAAAAAAPGRVRFVNSALGYQLEVPSQWEKIDKVRRRRMGILACMHGLSSTAGCTAPALLKVDADAWLAQGGLYASRAFPFLESMRNPSSAGPQNSTSLLLTI